MVVLFPFVGDSVGGSHISTLELYYALIDKKITALIVLHVHDCPLAKYLRNKNIPFYVLKPSALAGSSPKKIDIIVGIISNFFNFVKFIKKYKIDIVHGNDLRVNLSWSIPAKIYTKGFVWHQRTLLSDSKLWFLIRYMCNYFIAISNAVMQSAPININNNKKQIIYNPFNVDSTTNKKLERKCIFDRYSLPQDCFLIGCVGRIVDYKNIDYVINNICNIRKKSNKNVYLIIIGSGPDKYVEKLIEHAKNIGAYDYIKLTGFINNPYKIISSLNLLIAPSTKDAFGRSIVEAMLQKTLVLAANSGGHIDIIDDGYNGFLYDSNSKKDLVDKVLMIMNSVNIEKLSENSYGFAKLNFATNKHSASVLAVYDNLLSH